MLNVGVGVCGCVYACANVYLCKHCKRISRHYVDVLIVCLASLLPCEDVGYHVCAYLVCRYSTCVDEKKFSSIITAWRLMTGSRIFDIVEAHCCILYTDDEGLRGRNVLQLVAID